MELNNTSETLDVSYIAGGFPNCGLLQGDINLSGLRYLQQVSDATTGSGLHIEPGLWVSVPATSNPAEPATVARMGSIPHGTTINAQGPDGGLGLPGKPNILPASITPSSSPAGAPNADAAQMTAVFWIETVQNPNGSKFLQLQSALFPNVFLRQNGTGVNASHTTGGVVNCQLGLGTMTSFLIVTP